MPYEQRPATPKQIRYLRLLRRRIGLAAWNELKREMGIARPGTYNLTFSEARALLNVLAPKENEDEPMRETGHETVAVKRQKVKFAMDMFSIGSF